MPDDIIYPPGVLVGTWGDNAEAAINNSLVDHHHLSPSLRMSMLL